MITICIERHYPDRDRFRYVQEFRHMFGQAYSKEGELEWQHTPDWAIAKEQYTLGFWPPNYPMPAIRYVADWFKSDLITDVVIFRVYTGDDYELPEVVAHYT